MSSFPSPAVPATRGWCGRPVRSFTGTLDAVRRRVPRFDTTQRGECDGLYR